MSPPPLDESLLLTCKTTFVTENNFCKVSGERRTADNLATTFPKVEEALQKCVHDINSVNS